MIAVILLAVGIGFGQVVAPKKTQVYIVNPDNSVEVRVARESKPQITFGVDIFGEPTVSFPKDEVDYNWNAE